MTERKKSPSPLYDVGWGKPPRHTRFEKGRSGNPVGGKKGPRSLDDLFDKIVAQKIPVTMGGVRVKMAKLEVIVNKIVNDALAG